MFSKADARKLLLLGFGLGIVVGFCVAVLMAMHVEKRTHDEYQQALSSKCLIG